MTSTTSPGSAGGAKPTKANLQAGAQLYFDSVNATGGINGSKIRLHTVDDGYKTTETVRLVQEVARDKKPLAFIASEGNSMARRFRDQVTAPSAGGGPS